MPFVSKKQRAYLAINKPDVAKKFAAHSKKSKSTKSRSSGKKGRGRK